MIVDEAHKLKNQQSRLFQSLSLLPREYCVLLTGTPLQNKTEVILPSAIEELLELDLYFVLKGALGTFKLCGSAAIQ